MLLFSLSFTSPTKTAITCLSSWCVLLPFSSLSLVALLPSRNGGDQFLCGLMIVCAFDRSRVSAPSSERRRRSRLSSARREKTLLIFVAFERGGAIFSISRSIVADENTIHVKTRQQNSSSETPVLGNPASSFASRTTRTKSRTSAPSGWTLKSELWNWKGKR